MHRTTALSTGLATALVAGAFVLSAPAAAFAGPAACEAPVARALHNAETTVGSAPVAGSGCCP
ncbi:hypothetical protein, partial [Nocardioides sp.]|uniref:hypothetical protein n=1 Tax=Nocardioides sp. TaxID=35761 RepID=UPI002B27A41E